MLSMEIQRRLLLSTSLVLLAMTTGLAVIKFLYVGETHLPFVAITMSVLFAANIAYIFLGGDLLSSQRLMLALMVFGFVFATVSTGGFSSAPIMLAPLLPMVTILWFDKRAGWMMGALLIVILSALLIAEYQGLLPDNKQTKETQIIAHFFMITTVTAVCTWLAWSFARTKEQHLDSNRLDASTDHLTGLANRRAIDEALLREVGRAKRNHAWFSFALIDVDFFKRYNDSLGHQAGDECLVKIAELIAANLKRSSDVAGRFGGEEFALILPDTDPEGAYNIAEAIRKQIASLKLTYTEKSDDCVTISIGLITVAGAQISSVEDLVKQADAALYRGKSGGRNQVVMKTVDALPLGLALQG
ncbi:MAG: diguanylate cyclase (GGDEF)-like protein [Pseudohongiellaceae bacterium]|jgi:diguanylate cyclase (GGDEF)-like protein